MYFVTLGHYVCPSRVSVDTRGVVGFVHTSLSVLLMGTNYQRSSYPFASSPVPRPGTDVTECVTFVTLGLHPVTCIYWLHHRLLCLGWLRYPYCILFAHYYRLTYLSGLLRFLPWGLLPGLLPCFYRPAKILLDMAICGKNLILKLVGF